MTDNQLNINKRFLIIIEKYEKNITTFAKKLDTTFPRIKNIITEKNKPSFDIIQKILELYPEINSDWLILGKGEMLKESYNKEILKEPDISYSVVEIVEETINERISRLIKDNNLTVKEFADKLGVGQSIIYHILNNRNKPGLDLIQKIAITFNISADYLILGIKKSDGYKSPLLMSKEEIEKIPTILKLKKRLEDAEKDNKLLKEIIEKLLETEK